MKKAYIGLLFVLGILFAVLGIFILYNQWPLISGKKIILATAPIDPFDPFRGQYLTIRYEISSLEHIKDLQIGDDVYVILEKDNQGIWRKKSVSKTIPSNGDYIRGKVVNNWRGASIEYGIEQYFFEKGATLPTRNITIELRVANSGRAKIYRLLHEGKPIQIEYKKMDITS